jgi:hypothetical protein
MVCVLCYLAYNDARCCDDSIGCLSLSSLSNLFLICFAGRQFATRSDNTAQRVNMSKSAGQVRLSENPVKLSAVHTAAMLLSSNDVLQQQVVMLPRYDFLGKIVHLVAHDIQSSGSGRGLFADLEGGACEQMDMSEETEEAEPSEGASVGSNQNVNNQ